MMNHQYLGIDQETRQIVEKLLKRLSVFNDQSYTFEFVKGEYPLVEKKETHITVIYSEKVTLFRGLLNSAMLILKNQSKIEEQSYFETKSIMLDMSRAGVMKVEQVCSYLDDMALFGLNALLLYMEDVFELEGYAYFGHLRGKYSKEELKAIDAYALRLGIEVVPCIQTLGHFEQYNKWAESSEVKDTSTVLLAENEKTYELIEKIIKTVSECFTSKKIHVGMDEAWDLGLGKYIKLKGYKEGTRIFCDHVVQVKKITDKYGLKPAIWSDMYFRLASKSGEYYEKDTEIPGFVRELLPENMMLTYWDYYHDDEETYNYMIEKHKKITDQIMFAGGIWCWNGFVPDLRHTFLTTNAGLSACKKKGIKHICGTVWGDDGCETDYRFSLIGALLYGEHSYRDEINEERLQELTKLLYQAELDNFLHLSEIVKSKEASWLTIKQIIYSDILVNMMGLEMNNIELLKKFEEHRDHYKKVSEQPGFFQTHFKYIYEICKLACEKIDIVINLNEGYKKKPALLREVVEKLSHLEHSYLDLKMTHYELWSTTNKPFGFEILDTRYGGKISRIVTAKHRINQYLNQEIPSLEELEEKQLPYAGQHFISGFYVGINSPYAARGY